MDAADGTLLTALTAELAGKSGLVWVAVGDQPARALWHAWHDGAVAIVTGGIEQDDPGLVDGGEVKVVLRSKENSARQLSIMATVERLDPAGAAWEAVVPGLHGKRLNAPDGEEQPRRWGRESSVWLLRPTGRATETPGAMSADAHHAEPLPSTATTTARAPFHAGRATRRRKRY